MVNFDSSRQGSPAQDGSCRRQNSLFDLKSGEMKLHNAEAKKAKSLRRKRMELLGRFRSISQEKSQGDLLVSSNHDVSFLKKKRSEVLDPKVTKNSLVAQLAENNVGRSRGVKCPSHGMISIIGRRRAMEDAVAVELGLLEKGTKSFDFFGVYDGHGGWRVAHGCSEMQHKLLVKIIEQESGEEIDWEKVMVAGFKKMDEEVNKSGAVVARMGSTAVVAVVGEEEVVVANCGDSRAVLSRGGITVQLSDDHKPDRPDELERIQAHGGKVINWNGQRVLGVLATSRSIGDHYLKPFVMTEPEVRVVNRTDMDEFMILASDGLWDVVSNDLACHVVRKCLAGQMRRGSYVSRVLDGIESGTQIDGMINESRTVEAAAVLAELAIARGSNDNISVIVVEL